MQCKSVLCFGSARGLSRTQFAGSLMFPHRPILVGNGRMKSPGCCSTSTRHRLACVASLDPSSGQPGGLNPKRYIRERGRRRVTCGSGSGGEAEDAKEGEENLDRDQGEQGTKEDESMVSHDNVVGRRSTSGEPLDEEGKELERIREEFQKTHNFMGRNPHHLIKGMHGGVPSAGDNMVKLGLGAVAVLCLGAVLGSVARNKFYAAETSASHHTTSYGVHEVTEEATEVEKYDYKFQKMFRLPFYEKVMYLVTFSITSVLIGGALYKFTTGRPFSYSAFKAYCLLNGVPGTDATGEDETGWSGIIAGNLIYMLGLFTFAIMIAVVTETVSAKVEHVQKGNHNIFEKDHTVVLNWNDSLVPLLRQLAIASKEHKGQQDLARVVVLANKPKEEMDQIVQNDIVDQGVDMEVITREGNPHDLTDLKRAAVWDAKTIICLYPGAKGDRSEFVNETKLYESASNISSTMLGIQHRAHKDQRVVIHMPMKTVGSELIDLACANKDSGSKGGVFMQKVWADRLLAKTSAQCALQPGLARVYNDLLTQSEEGAEFYFMKIEDLGEELVGLTFGQMWRRFPTAVACGVVRGPETKLNPNEDFKLEAGDKLIFVAGEEDDIKMSDLISYNKGLKKFQLARQEAESAKQTESSPDLTPPESKSHETEAHRFWRLGRRARLRAERQRAEAQAKALEEDAVCSRHIVSMGVNDRFTKFIESLNRIAEDAGEMTSLTIVTDSSFRPDFSRYPYLKLKYIEGHPLDPKLLTQAKIDEATCVRIPIGELRDSQTISAFAMLSKKFGIATAAKPDCHLLVALGDAHTEQLAQSVIQRFGLDPCKVDIRVDDDLLSGMLTQVAANPELQTVLWELLNPIGNEMYLADALRFTSGDQRQLSFGEMSARARSCDYIAIGYYLKCGELVLSPHKDMKRAWQPGDRLILLAEDWVQE